MCASKEHRINTSEFTHLQLFSKLINPHIPTVLQSLLGLLKCEDWKQRVCQDQYSSVQRQHIRMLRKRQKELDRNLPDSPHLLRC